MSWTTFIASTSLEDAPAAIAATTIHEDAIAEMHEQLAVAKDAATAMIASGALGAGPFSVSMSGHANEGHGDTAGWSRDAINVSISRLPAPPVVVASATTADEEPVATEPVTLQADGTSDPVQPDKDFTLIADELNPLSDNLLKKFGDMGGWEVKRLEYPPLDFSLKPTFPLLGE